MASGPNNVTRSGDPVAAFLRQVSPARSCNPDAARQWARCPLSAQMDLYPARRRLSHELLPGVTEGCWEGTTKTGRLGIAARDHSVRPIRGDVCRAPCLSAV